MSSDTSLYSRVCFAAIPVLADLSFLHRHRSGYINETELVVQGYLSSKKHSQAKIATPVVVVVIMT